MILSIQALGVWLLQSALGGGVLLLLTLGWMRWARQPAFKQRLGEWGLAAALAVCLLSLLPAWFVLPWNVANLLSPLEVGDASPRPGEVALVVPSEPAGVPASQPFKERGSKVEDRGSKVEDRGSKIEDRWSSVDTQQTAGLDSRFSIFDPRSLIVDPPSSAATIPNLVVILSAGLVIVYLVGLTVLLVRLALAFVALRRLVRRCIPAPGALQELLAELEPDRPAPRLLQSPHLSVPVSFGLLRPTIVLPARLSARLDPSRLRWVLAHELTHLRRRDAWSGLLCAVAQALFFYLPWCWSVCRQIRLCQEFVADAAAVPVEQGPDYAEFLLTLTRAPALPLVAASVSGKASDLFRRVSMLLERPIAVERTGSRRILLCGAAALFALAVVVSGVSWAGGDRPIIIILGGSGEAQESKSPAKVAVTAPAPQQEAGNKGFKVIILQDGKVISGGKEGGERIAVLPKFVLKRTSTNEGQEQIQVIVIKDGKVLVRPIEGVGALPVVPSSDGQGGKRVLIPAAPGKENVQYWTRVAPIETKVKIIKEEVKLAPAAPGKTPASGGYLYVPTTAKAAPGDNYYYVPTTAKVWQEGKAQPPVVVWEVKGKQVDQKDVEDALKRLENVLSKQEMEKVRQEVHKALKAAERARAEGDYRRALGIAQHKELPFYYGVTTATPHHFRLGVSVNEPGSALIDQLNLPKGQGIVVLNVLPDSPAEKANVKANDVLLAIGGKTIPSDPNEFLKLTNALPVGKAVALVLVRKGQKLTLHSIQLRELPKHSDNLNRVIPAQKDPPAFYEVPVPGKGNSPYKISPRDPKAPAVYYELLDTGKDPNVRRVPPPLANKLAPGDADKSVMLTVLRTADRFTARHQEGSLIITVTGQAAGAKARVSEINIQDGTQSSKYQRVQDVPAQYRDKVEQIVDLANRGNLQVQTH
jgi:beta-lactamase regulating signal transducer with metallopeptidase domain